MNIREISQHIFRYMSHQYGEEANTGVFMWATAGRLDDMADDLASYINHQGRIEPVPIHIKIKPVLKKVI